MSIYLKSCLICNSFKINNCVSIFDNELVLKSGTKLTTIVSKILDEQVTKTKSQSKELVLCKSCYEYCIEYDVLHSRLSEIKTGLKLQHNSSLLKGDNQNEKPNISKPNTPKKLVLPATKLKPVSPNFIINMAPLVTNVTPIVTNTTAVTSATSNQTIEIKSGMLLSNKKTTTTPTIKYPNINILKSPPKITKQIQKKLPKLAPKTSIQIAPKMNVSQNQNIIPVILPRTSNILASSTSLLTNSNSLLQNPNSLLQTTNTTQLKTTSLLQSSTLLRQTSKIATSTPVSILRNTLTNKRKDYIESLGSNVIMHEPMDIDEECTYVHVGTGEVGRNILQEVDESNEELIKITLPDIDETSNDDPLKESDYVIGKVEIMEGDNESGDDDHAIIMEEGDNGSIIRLMSGQKFIYNDKEISLIIPEADNDDDADDNGASDSQEVDNIEESQIELKMAGDEKTANAIKNAASNHGTTYVKTATGEMFEVESVATEKEEECTNDAPGIVTRDGKHYKCVLCEKHKSESRTFKAEGDIMMRHIREVHNARVYICMTCKAIMRKRSDYTDHVTMHAEELTINSGFERNKQYECHHCSKKFTSRNILKDHMNTHDGTKAHRCEQCNKTFASKYTFQAHAKIHTDRPRPFTCSLCEKSFYTLQNLSQHSKIHEVREEFECLVCHKTFGSQHNLEVHGIVHSGKKPFLCGVCDKRFARRAEIRDHMRIHTGERPFKCDICGSAFSQRSNLQSHKRATHYNDLRYSCTQCPKKFKRRRLLDYHVMACHTGERPFKCDLCDSTFIYPEHFKKHMLGHTGSKPYECNVCKKAFSSRDNRNVHMFTHSDRKPYECVECGANYMRRPQLLAHMRNAGHLAEKIIINNKPKFYSVNEGLTENLLQGSEIEPTPSNSEEAKLLITNKGIILRDDIGNEQMYTVDFENSVNSQQFFTAELTDENITNATEICEAQIENVTENQQEIIAKDSSGGVMFRLVQMKLENGERGWVTLEE